MIKKMKKEQILIVALFGILCLVVSVPVPKKEKTERLVQMSEERDKMQEETVESQLKKILQSISGVGTAEVFITYADRGKKIVGKDESVSEELIQEKDSNGGIRTTTITQNDCKTVYGTEEMPYVVQELTPEISGILVVAEGAGNVSVKKQIQEAIEALFGLDAHKISIMKMEVSR